MAFGKGRARERAVTKVVIVISGRVKRVKLDFSIQRVAKEILIIMFFFLIESSGFPALLSFAETKIRINDNIFRYFKR